MSGYQAVLMAPDGDYVTDYSADTVEEVEEAVDNQGSRWFFYPFIGITEGGRVSDDSRMVRVFGYWGDEVYLDGSPYKGATLAEWRDGVVEAVGDAENVPDLPTCPKCHGAGKVDPDEVEA